MDSQHDNVTEAARAAWKKQTSRFKSDSSDIKNIGNPGNGKFNWILLGK
jgi:hypothetical protein